MNCLACGNITEEGPIEMEICTSCGFKQFDPEQPALIEQSQERVYGAVTEMLGAVNATGTCIPAQELMLASAIVLALHSGVDPTESLRKTAELLTEERLTETWTQLADAYLDQYRADSKEPVIPPVGEVPQWDGKPDLDKPGALEEIAQLEDDLRRAL